MGLVWLIENKNLNLVTTTSVSRTKPFFYAPHISHQISRFSESVLHSETTNRPHNLQKNQLKTAKTQLSRVIPEMVKIRTRIKTWRDRVSFVNTKI